MQLYDYLLIIYFVLGLFWTYKNGMRKGCRSFIFSITAYAWVSVICFFIVQKAEVYSIILMIFLTVFILIMLFSLLEGHTSDKVVTKKITFKDMNKYTTIEQINTLPRKQKLVAYIIKKNNNIYVTNATKKELEMKKNGFFLFNKKTS